MTSLAETIAALFSAGANTDKDAARKAFFELQRGLNSGEVRAAEPDPTSPTGWRVNEWVKQGILLGFRFGDMVDASADHGKWPFFDKDTMLVKKPVLTDGIRIVPGGSTIRSGSFVARGVVCIPPMWINIGAYVGEGTLIDSHALIGSCAQIGARVHVSAAAQIGGVIEPVGAMPVIVEDDVLVGGNTGIYEGAVIKQRAVIAAGTILTGSTPVYDLVHGRIIKPEPGQPLVIPEGAVVVPGARAVTVGAGKDWGLSLATPVIVKYRDDKTDTRTELESWNPMTKFDLVGFARALVDIDSTTGREQEAGAFIARTLRELGWHVDEQPLTDGRFNVIARIDEPRVVLSTHFDCVPPFFPSRIEGTRLYGRGSCDAKGILAAQVAAAERARAEGRRDVGLLFVAGEERGSDGAKAANIWPTSSQFLINGEPTDNRLGIATKGVYRARLVATGRAAHSSQPELGESAIDKLIDALVSVRGVAWPVDPLFGVTNYSVGLISGGVAPNVIAPLASAELMFRTVGDYLDVRAMLATAAGPLASVEDALVVPPVRLHTVPGFDTAVFSFTTDVPFLDRWGTPLLLGPGSITVAHTDEESVEIADLSGAADGYSRLIASL